MSEPLRLLDYTLYTLMSTYFKNLLMLVCKKDCVCESDDNL